MGGAREKEQALFYLGGGMRRREKESEEKWKGRERTGTI